MSDTTSKTHELKVLQPMFPALVDGSKTFEVRKNDRGFQVGDTLILMRWGTDPVTEVEGFMSGDAETGMVVHRIKADFVKVKVTYILPGGQFGVDPDYVVMGFRFVSYRDTNVSGSEE